jgi:hypothetical protein
MVENQFRLGHCTGTLTGHDYDRMTGPPTLEKFRMYRNLVAAPAFLVMIGLSATVFI